MKNLKKISDNELFHPMQKVWQRGFARASNFWRTVARVCKDDSTKGKVLFLFTNLPQKLAGLTYDQVDTYIRLERKYEDKPALHRALVEGQISVNKLVRIASIGHSRKPVRAFLKPHKNYRRLRLMFL